MPQKVAVQLFKAVAGSGVQVPTLATVDLTVLHVVLVQPLPALAIAAVQLGPGVGPVVTAGEQVVLVQLLPVLALAAVHDATPVGPVLFGAQLVLVKPLLASAGAAVQLDTPLGPLFTVLQLMAV